MGTEPRGAPWAVGRPSAWVGVTSSSDRPGQQVASGTVVAEGLVVTAAHAVTSRAGVRVLSPSTESVARVVRVDEDADLALLEVSGPTAGVGSLRRTPVVPGEAVGVPLADPESGTYEASSIRCVDDRWMTVATDGVPGTSGSPVVDRAGDVVGIVVSTEAGDRGLRAVGVDRVRRLLAR